jgi:hypothetical protein
MRNVKICNLVTKSEQLLSLNQGAWKEIAECESNACAPLCFADMPSWKNVQIKRAFA